MNQFRILLFAFALTSFSMSFVVYGQLSQAHHDTCLIIGFRSSQNNSNISAQYKKVPNAKIDKIQALLNYANIPLEISYVKSGKQIQSFLNILAFLPSKETIEPLIYTGGTAENKGYTLNLTAKPEQYSAYQTIESQNTENIKMAESPQIEAVKIMSEPLSKTDEIVYTEVSLKEIEKPVLRLPRNEITN